MKIFDKTKDNNLKNKRETVNLHIKKPIKIPIKTKALNSPFVVLNRNKKTAKVKRNEINISWQKIIKVSNFLALRKALKISYTRQKITPKPAARARPKS